MKLHLAQLAKMIELPSTSPQSSGPQEVRQILDDLGLEVKDTTGEELDTVFTIETLANRGDHLYTLGVARELSARFLSSVRQPPLAPAFQGLKATLPVRRMTEACSRYALLEVQLPSDATTAEAKLRPEIAAALTTLHGDARVVQTKPVIVNVLNFVQLELGQPMHAFDRDAIEGEIVIALTERAEEIEALDGKSYQVPEGSIVIRDRKKIVAVAGVIGCANSMVNHQTSRVLLESAAFDPVRVRKTARGMGLSTDASYAFERGTDREMILPALRRALFLLDAAGGAVKQESGAHVIGLSVAEAPAVSVSPIKLTLKEVRQHLNLPRLAEVEIASRLKNLGFSVQSIEEGAAFSIVPPSWRVWDIKNTADLIEEVVRTLSLSRVKQELPPLEYETPDRTAIEQLRERIEPVLIGQGFIEVMTRSYYAAEVAETLTRIGRRTLPRHITIKNALERGYSHLKISNVVHLAELLEENIRHGVRGARVFECARVFSPDYAAEDGYPFEKEVLSLACAGRWVDREWRKPESTEQKLQLFRGVLDTLIESAGYEPSVGESDDAFLHPGMQGSLKAGRSICGKFGLMHPELAAGLGIKTPVLYAELDVSVLMRVQSARERVFPSDFPSVKRDITLQVPLRERVGKIERMIGEAKLANLTAVEITDDFKKPEEDFRRATFRLVFQSRERTLSHPEVDAEMERLLSALKESAGLVLAA